MERDQARSGVADGDVPVGWEIGSDHVTVLRMCRSCPRQTVRRTGSSVMGSGEAVCLVCQAEALPPWGVRIRNPPQHSIEVSVPTDGAMLRHTT